MVIKRWNMATKCSCYVYPNFKRSAVCSVATRQSSDRMQCTFVRPGTHYPHVTWAHVMLRVQLGCERRFTIEFYGTDSHFCHFAYVTWSHVQARLSHFCCRTHFVRRDDVTYVSSALQTLSISCLQKNILFMSAPTLKPIRLECYLPRLPGAKSAHEITWCDGMHVSRLTWRELTWREDSVSAALFTAVTTLRKQASWLGR